jgi:DNA-binding NarL/FixJ family response regulator
MGATVQSSRECLVLLIDHQPLFLEALAKVVAAVPGVQVEKLALGETFEAPDDVQPDIVTLDPWVGGEFRVDYLEAAKRLWPGCRFVVVTDCDDADAIVSALAHGAHSYILKMEPTETIQTAIELVCRGAAAFSLPAAATVAARVIPARAAPSLPGPAARGLSPREVEIMQLVARGYTDAEIGRGLRISVRTVHRHVTNTLNKLGCRNRSQAVAEVIGAAPPLARKR